MEDEKNVNDKLHDTISTIAYVLDILTAYRNIISTGDCNRCANTKDCGYCPEPGQLVRYNCPFFSPVDQ